MRGPALGGSGFDRERDATDPSPLEISRKVRQPYLVPESLGVLEALADMRKHRRAVAVVVDEYGGVAGVLTVKDLLEPLVGDLHDEFDEETRSRRSCGWTHPLADRRADQRGRRAGADRDRDPRRRVRHPRWSAVRAFRPHPRGGRGVRVGDWDLRVVEMDKRRVAQVVATFAGGWVRRPGCRDRTRRSRADARGVNRPAAEKRRLTPR